MLILYFPILGNVAYSISINKNESNQIDQLKKKYLRPENIPHPVDNPYSKEKFELGKRLFFETRISRSNITSCASCHNPSLLWTDGLPVAVGDFHVLLTRKTQSIENLAWDELFFWDGRAESLEDQVITSITSTQEINIDMAKAVEKLNLIKGYKPFLRAAYHVENFSEEIISKH